MMTAWDHAFIECALEQRWHCIYNHPWIAGRFEFNIPTNHEGATCKTNHFQMA